MQVCFCGNNRGKGPLLRRLEEEHPELEVQVRKCLGMCSSCAERPVAMVAGRKVTGINADDIYLRILAIVTEAAQN